MNTILTSAEENITISTEEHPHLGPTYFYKLSSIYCGTTTTIYQTHKEKTTIDNGQQIFILFCFLKKARFNFQSLWLYEIACSWHL